MKGWHVAIDRCIKSSLLVIHSTEAASVPSPFLWQQYSLRCLMVIEAIQQHGSSDIVSVSRKSEDTGSVHGYKADPEKP